MKTSTKSKSVSYRVTYSYGGALNLIDTFVYDGYSMNQLKCQIDRLRRDGFGIVGVEKVVFYDVIL